MYLKQNDPESQSYLTAFREGLQKAGWIVGRNLEIEYRWTGGDPQLTRKYAAELVALNPHVILTAGGAQVGPLQEVTRSIPIVFVQVADAVGAGFVNSLAKPGGNATGFTNGQFDISAKWLEVLKQISPSMKKGNREMCKWTRRLNNFRVEGVLFVLLATASVASALDVGDKAPDFKLPSTNGVDIALSDFRGKKWVFLEFYAAAFVPT